MNARTIRPLLVLLVPVGLFCIVYGVTNYNALPYHSYKEFSVEKYRDGRLVETYQTTSLDRNRGHIYSMQLVIVVGALLSVTGLFLPYIIKWFSRRKTIAVETKTVQKGAHKECHYCNSIGNYYVCPACKSNRKAGLLFTDQTEECTACGKYYNNGHYEVCENCGNRSFRAI